MSPTVSVTVWGEYALFTRPELSVERLSYPCMIPSAARGVLDAILFKPQMRWHLRRIVALHPRTFPPGFPTASANQPYRLVGVRRNEIQGTSAQILERYFSTASTSPRSVFPTLLRLNRHHITKIRDDNIGVAFNLEQELEERVAPFKREDQLTPDFPGLLSLPEQGQFALGFYHQRAAYRSKPVEETKTN